MTDPEKQLEKLKTIIDVLDTDRASVDETAEAFQAVLNVIKQLKDTIDRDMASNKGEMDNLYAGVLEELKKTEQRLIKMSDKLESKMDANISIVQKQLLQEVNSIKDTIPSIPSFQPLEDRISEVERKIPEMPKMPDLKPLETKDKQLEEEIKELKDKLQKLSELPRGRVGGARKTTSTKRINLTSQCNGTLKSFALPKDVIEVLGVWGTQFPITFDTADFTLTGNTLTLTSEVSAPETNQTLFALVTTLFY